MPTYHTPQAQMDVTSVHLAIERMYARLPDRYKNGPSAHLFATDPALDPHLPAGMSAVLVIVPNDDRGEALVEAIVEMARQCAELRYGTRGEDHVTWLW